MKLNERGKIVKECWFDLPNHYDNIKLDEFVIMPNHIHSIIMIVNGMKMKMQMGMGLGWIPNQIKNNTVFRNSFVH